MAGFIGLASLSAIASGLLPTVVPAVSAGNAATTATVAADPALAPRAARHALRPARAGPDGTTAGGRRRGATADAPGRGRDDHRSRASRDRPPLAAGARARAHRSAGSPPPPTSWVAESASTSGRPPGRRPWRPSGRRGRSWPGWRHGPGDSPASTPRSELSRLNAADSDRVAVGPTLTAVLDWGRGAEATSDGIVDIGLLDARLLAESGANGDSAGARSAQPANRRWSLLRHARGAIVERPSGLRFDLDGIAKGWLADRALDLLPGLSAVVDADGDIAARVVDDLGWDVGVANPREAGTVLSTVRSQAGHRTRRPVRRRHRRAPRCTGGRWADMTRHHLIDPRTRRPAATDVVQATVIARTARAAEAFAKTAVIVGSDEAAGHLDRPDVLGQVLLTDAGNVLVTPATLEYLA